MVKIFLPFFHTIFQFHFSFSLFFQLYLSHLLREIIDIDRDTWNSRELIFKDMCICIYIYIGGEKFSSHQTNSILL